MNVTFLPPLRIGAITLIAGLFLARSLYLVEAKREFVSISTAQSVSAHKPNPVLGQLQPGEAERFLEWIIPYATDFAPDTAQRSQEWALRWTMPSAENDLKQHFYRYQCLDRDLRFVVQEYSERPPNSDGTVSVDVDGVFVRSVDVEPVLALRMTIDVLCERDGFRLSNVDVTDDPRGERVKWLFEQ